MRAVVLSLAVRQAFAQECCWGKYWGCEGYPAGRWGGLCDTDWDTTCNTKGDCGKVSTNKCCVASTYIPCQDWRTSYGEVCAHDMATPCATNKDCPACTTKDNCPTMTRPPPTTTSTSTTTTSTTTTSTTTTSTSTTTSTTTVPPPSSCNLPERVAEEVSPYELAQALYDEKEQAAEVDHAIWAAKSYGALGLGFLGSLGAAGVAIGPKSPHALRHLGLGVDAMAKDPFDASERRQAAQVVMEFTMENTYDDLNDMMSDVNKCITDAAADFRKELKETRDRLEVRMQTRDFTVNLHKLFLSTQHRLGTVLDYLSAQDGLGNVTWLVSSVEEGLHTCVDIGSLVDLVSEKIIMNVMEAMPVVNRWFTMCVAFINLSKKLQDLDVGGVAFNVRYRTQVFLGQHFLNFYKEARCRSPHAASANAVVRPFELRVQNFLNLGRAKYEHAILKSKVPNVTFPQRQGQLKHGQPEDGLSSLSGNKHGGYIRSYSMGAVKSFSETCRFCRFDGVNPTHYGCWEEQAVSFNNCVGNGGIYYNESLPVSNEFGCDQFRDFEHMRLGARTECGGRPEQKNPVVEQCQP